MKRKKSLNVRPPETTKIDEKTDSDVAALVPKQKAPKTPSKDDRGQQSEDEACSILNDIDAVLNEEEKLGEDISL